MTTADLGSELDAQAAAAAFRQLVAQAEATLAQSVLEAPIDSPEHAETHHHRPPGELRASAHIVYLVNEQNFTEPDPAETAIIALARARQLYRVDAELRYDTPYARHQHDRLPHAFKRGQWRHLHGGGAKYLEHPIQMARPQLDYRLRQAMTTTTMGLGADA